MVLQNSLGLQNMGETHESVRNNSSGEGLVVGCNRGRANISRNQVLGLGAGLQLIALVQPFIAE